MSILDTFFILFETNARQTADDMKRLDTATEQVEREFKRADKAAYEFGQSIGRSLRNLAATYISFQAVKQGVGLIATRAGEIADLDQFAKGLDIATTRLDAFRRVAQTSGSTAEDAFNGLTIASKNIGEALGDVKSPQAELFKSLNVNLKDTSGNARNALDVMLDVAGSLEKMSRPEAIARLKELGIRNNALVSIFLQGKSALKEMIDAQEKNGALTAAQIKAANELDEKLDRLELQWISIKNQLVEAVGPALEFVAEMLMKALDWASKNADVINGALVPALIGLAVVAWAAGAPFTAVAAGIAAVITIGWLLYDDFKVWERGGKSMLGAWLGPLDQVRERFGWIYDILEKIIGLLPALNKIARVLNPVTAQTAIAGAIGEMFNHVPVRRGQMLVTQAARTPVNMQPNGALLMAGARNRNVNQRNYVTVNTQATDAEGTGRAVGNHMQKEMRAAVDNADDGVDR